MRRAPIVVGATAAGLAAVLAFHTPPNQVNLGGAIGAGTSKAASGSSVASGTPGTGTGRGSTTTNGNTTSPSTTTPSTTTPSTTATRTATGPLINYFYGELSVTVTVSGTHVTNVGIASLNDGGNFRSQSIDQQSIPVLEQETVQAQSASIQGVSGATYTSTGFDQSLQGALKKLGL